MDRETRIHQIIDELRRGLDRLEALILDDFAPDDIYLWVQARELAPLIKAIARAESNFDPYAESPAGAQGLMQLMPAIQKHFGVTDAFDPKQSVEAGEKLLEEELDRFGTKELALAAYNAGSPAIKRAQARAGAKDFESIKPYLAKETQHYVPRVLSFYKIYKNQDQGLYFV